MIFKAFRPEKQIVKDDPDLDKFENGEYVSNIHFEPYGDETIKYGEIMKKSDHFHNIYIVRKFNGELEMWYEDSMSKISELDAFLRTLES